MNYADTPLLSVRVFVCAWVRVLCESFMGNRVESRSHLSTENTPPCLYSLSKVCVSTLFHSIFSESFPLNLSTTQVACQHSHPAI